MTIYKKFIRIILLITILILSFLVPLASDSLWKIVLDDIRESIISGNTGHLILASAVSNFIFTIEYTLLFIGTGLFMKYVFRKSLSFKIYGVLHFFLFNLLLKLTQGFAYELYEPVTAIVSTTAAFLLVYLYSDEKGKSHLAEQTILSIQFFYAFQWLNVMPYLTKIGFGISDISNSIKVSSVFQGYEGIMNFTGLLFLLPFVFSGIMTKIIYLQHGSSLLMAKENMEKEKVLASLKSKVIENMVYEEINTLTHDLKTPLVTIRGLNSLLTLTSDSEKISEYSSRIEGAVMNMNEMISGFLYEYSRQKTKAEDVISYVRAQIPLEDERIGIDIEIGESLPLLYINKIRVSRALMNVIENAIVVPRSQDSKKIDIRAYEKDGYFIFEVEDNGIGITEENLDKIWEAGFSSKKTSGLGLAFVKKVIEDNLGEVNIESKVDKGTRVILKLPGIEMI
jgi:signal transduction histidine kinase